MLLTVFSTKDTGGPRLLRILPICPKTYWTEGLHFVDSYCVCHAKKQMLFPLSIKSYLIAFLFVFLHSHYPCPDEARPKASPSQGSCRLYPEEQLLGFTDLLASH